MLRSIAAVVAGYVVFGVSAALLFQLSGQAPHADAPLAFKVASIVWGAVFALVAGWLASRIAVRRPVTHGALVAALIALGAIISLVASPPGAIWSQVAALVVMAPCAVIGGVISSRGRGTALETGDTGR